MGKRIFKMHVGVFGLAAIIDAGGKIRIKLNERTDRARQLQIANLPPTSKVRIVDCPGGGVDDKDTSLTDAVIREIAEETGGCKFLPMGQFSAPFPLFNNMDWSKPADMAMWTPGLLEGDPQPSAEAVSHPWISREEFEAETEWRCVSGLGNKGRTGRMVREAFEFYEARLAEGVLNYFTRDERESK